MQLDQDRKGFSFLKEGPLDMRMDPTAFLSAEHIVNQWSEQDLGRIFREYGEEPRWKIAAKAIVQIRKKNPIRTTKQLVDAILTVCRSKIHGKLHPATLIFQALRICVNRELDVLKETIAKAIPLLAPGGRIGVISFHSLEDRIVKTLFKQATTPIREGKERLAPWMTLLTKKPIVPSLAEIRLNPRSRSAKMRFAEKKG